MNTLNLRCSLNVPKAQTWFFIVKSLLMDSSLKDIVTDSDVFEIVDHDDVYIMTHHSKMYEDCRELFAFEKDNTIPAHIMYSALVSTLKNTWAEHLI
jgi:hypothetical protein